MGIDGSDDPAVMVVKKEVSEEEEGEKASGSCESKAASGERALAVTKKLVGNLPQASKKVTT